MGEWVNVDVVVPDIDGWLGVLNRYANDAINSADAVAAGLAGFAPDQYNPNVHFDKVSTDVSLDTATKPSKPSVSTGTNKPPDAITLTAPVVSLGSAPTFTETDPSLNLPKVPDPLNISAPVKDFIVDTSIDFPIAPNDPLPLVPTFLELNIPSPQDLTIPSFTLDFPTSNSIIIPGNTFSFSEINYSDDLLEKVKDELLWRLDGGTGLNPLVEAAIWNRGRDRESKSVVLAERALLVDRASQGFSRPTGAQLAALEGIVQEAQSKIIELSREIMIKQAELEQENIKTTIQQTIALEDILIRENLAINQRRFEVAKYMQDVAVELFKAQVALYNSEVEAYKAFASAYSARVQAELAKVEIFKAQIEAEKLKGDINEQSVKLYVAQLEGIKTNVEIYKSLMSAVSEKLRAEGLKLEVYKTDVEAYATSIKAKSEEYSMYSEQIKGELAKVEVFDSKVKAYASRIQAYASQSDVTLKKAETEVKVEDLKLEKYKADLDAYINKVKADQLIYETAVDIYKGETQMYLADISANKAVAELELKQAENTITQNKYVADIAIANAQISLESVKAAYQALLESKKAAGSIYSQIGGSALSAINVSAQVQAQAGIDLTESHVYQNQ